MTGEQKAKNRRIAIACFVILVWTYIGLILGAAVPGTVAVTLQGIVLGILASASFIFAMRKSAPRKRRPVSQGPERRETEPLPFADRMDRYVAHADAEPLEQEFVSRMPFWCALSFRPKSRLPGRLGIFASCCTGSAIRYELSSYGMSRSSAENQLRWRPQCAAIDRRRP